MCEDLPPGWGVDALTNFIEKARRNTLVTFANLRPAFDEIAAIDAMVVQALQDGRYPRRFEMAGIIMTKAVSNFRAGIALAAAGHLSEAQLMVRSILESGMYALAVAQDADLATTWRQRDESDASRDAMREAFVFGSLRRRFVERIDPALSQSLKERYDRAIAQGAHPNVGGARSFSERREGEDHSRVNTELLSGDLAEIEPALRDVAEALVIAAKLFALTVPRP